MDPQNEDGDYTYGCTDAECGGTECCVCGAVRALIARAEQAERERDLAEHATGRAMEERDQARAEVERLDKALDKALGTIERHEDTIEAVAESLGCEQEWSNCHDHSVCALESAASMRAEVERLRLSYAHVSVIRRALGEQSEYAYYRDSALEAIRALNAAYGKAGE